MASASRQIACASIAVRSTLASSVGFLATASPASRGMRGSSTSNAHLTTSDGSACRRADRRPSTNDGTVSTATCRRAASDGEQLADNRAPCRRSHRRDKEGVTRASAAASSRLRGVVAVSRSSTSASAGTWRNTAATVSGRIGSQRQKALGKGDLGERVATAKPSRTAVPPFFNGVGSTGGVVKDREHVAILIPGIGVLDHPCFKRLPDPAGRGERGKLEVPQPQNVSGPCCWQKLAQPSDKNVLSILAGIRIRRQLPDQSQGSDAPLQGRLADVEEIGLLGQTQVRERHRSHSHLLHEIKERGCLPMAAQDRRRERDRFARCARTDDRVVGPACRHRLGRKYQRRHRCIDEVAWIRS